MLEPLVEGASGDDDSGEKLTSVKPSSIPATTTTKPTTKPRDIADEGVTVYKNYTYKRTTKCFNGKCEVTICMNGELCFKIRMKCLSIKNVKKVQKRSFEKGCGRIAVGGVECS